MKKATFSKYAYSNPVKILRMGGVIELCGLSKSHIHSLISQGKFPKGVLIVPGGVAKGWLESEIVEWIEQRVAERDQEVANV